MIIGSGGFPSFYHWAQLITQSAQVSHSVMTTATAVAIALQGTGLGP